MFRWLGRTTLIFGPLIVLLVAVLTAFLMWVLVTAPGTRWALTTAVEAMDGHVQDVEGSVWKGLQIGDLSLEFPGLSLRLEQLELKADWRRLTERRLHVLKLSAETAWVDIRSVSQPQPEDAAEEPFAMPELPVTIRADSVSLGELILTQEGRPLPMTLQGFEAALALNEAHAQLWLRGASVATDSLEATIQGEANLQALHAPWPATIDLDVSVNGLRPGAPVCFRQMMPTLPVAQAQQDDLAGWLAGLAAGHCPVELQAQAEGSLDAMKVAVQGGGQGMELDALAELEPQANMPLRSAKLDLRLPDGASLNANAKLGETAAESGWAVLEGELAARALDAGQLAGGLIPAALLSFDSQFSLQLDANQVVRDIALELKFHEGSTWNEQALTGGLNVAARLPDVWASPPEVERGIAKDGAPEANADNHAEGDAPSNRVPAPRPFLPPGVSELAVHRLDIDLRLGGNHVRTEGGLGPAKSRLALDVDAPRLNDFWPDLPGGVTAKGNVTGGVAAHTVDMQVRYVPGSASNTELGTAPMAVQLKAEGSWGGAPEGWRGRLATLQAQHAHLGLSLGSPVELGYFPAVQAPQWQWTVGPAELAFSVHKRTMLNLRHIGSRGGAGRWETEGSIARFIVSPAALEQFGADFNIEALQRNEKGGVKVKGARSADDWELAFGLDWQLRFSGAHEGRIQLRRLSGDLMVPGEMPFPLELQNLQLDVALTRAGETRSRVEAALVASSRRMGSINAKASTMAHATAGGGLFLDPADVKSVQVEAALADLGWTSLLVGDALDIGGTVQANVQLESRPDGTWASSGTIQGDKLRVVMIDQGVRLLDGTLQARLENDRLLLEKLEFPARLRAEPKEWRTSEWVNTNPDAKGGKLTVTGDWNLFESRGLIDIALYRFPILQRADRYAMMTGNLRLDAALPDVAISGKLTADAGWFDLDMLGGIPTVDSDVVVVRAGEEKEPSVPLGVTLDMEVDLGPRFYLTGYGLNSGLVGNMRVLMKGGKLTGMGALRTRGGAIEAYGQRLQLRRGAITFQGDITRPVLDIEALRTGLAVEAGVRVAGTARSPRIELVSYPAVSEIEKLSWLLLGHGPNDSGGDMALLFSVGSSFLSDGEPFYRRFGIDEVSMRSGELGSVASVLPVESVVSGLDTGTSDIERRFINVSKRLSSGVTISIRQALSDTGTVARASYRLARGLTAEASVGTINGLALVYRWFSRERSPETQN
ncbi:MAG TPA: translocation/assembly module TamB domain-containing protein [Burkholderiaceae bacterium]|nr:translocation/assembly module TamB domain-containing protein [Burkholderiaceae bacterium]